jgi:hypothetical protein
MNDFIVHLLYICSGYYSTWCQASENLGSPFPAFQASETSSQKNDRNFLDRKLTPDSLLIFIVAPLFYFFPAIFRFSRARFAAVRIVVYWGSR